MRDDIGIAPELDRLLPTEKMRDPKARGVRKEGPSKKKGEKDRRGFPPEEDAPEEEAPTDHREDRNSGKVLDVLI
jgi:hypothetical protein